MQAIEVVDWILSTDRPTQETPAQTMNDQGERVGLYCKRRRGRNEQSTPSVFLVTGENAVSSMESSPMALREVDEDRYES